VLILPGGGAIARPVHDGLFGAFGVGAWFGVAGLILTGIRLCLTPQWRAGTLAALGSVVAMAALLGLTGMVGSDAGVAGRGIGNGVEHVLGGAGAAVALIVVAFLGIIVATDLRTGAILRAMGEWFAAEGDERRRQHAAAASRTTSRASSRKTPRISSSSWKSLIATAGSTVWRGATEGKGSSAAGSDAVDTKSTSASESSPRALAKSAGPSARSNASWAFRTVAARAG